MIERRGMDNLCDNSCAELGALFQWVLKPPGSTDSHSGPDCLHRMTLRSSSRFFQYQVCNDDSGSNIRAITHRPCSAGLSMATCILTEIDNSEIPRKNNNIHTADRQLETYINMCLKIPR